ncbi:hypothetical protein [Paenibacillus aquistagni]|uniref:hypothetical protein n=1 Tax=Paenibacillus aquistagni TaxID=1852522 RepID=UPI00145B1802|nr:hypothetical protein [Paenibacillus aquistagni]NMM52048.1 hypothetical protein [Paenibacillus aquistagni]
MTLIAAFSTPHFAVMIADRRRTQLDTGVYYDDVRKLHRVNDKAIVGFAGIYHHDGAGRFIGMAERTINNCMFRIEKDTPVDVVAQIYSQYVIGRIRSGVPKEIFEITFHLAGIDSNDRYVLARVSHFEDFEPIIVEPQANGVIWGLSIADYSPSAWLNEQVSVMGDKSVEKVERLAKSVLLHTSQRDKYVSESYDILVMKADTCTHEESNIHSMHC